MKSVRVYFPRGSMRVTLRSSRATVWFDCGTLFERYLEVRMKCEKKFILYPKLVATDDCGGSPTPDSVASCLPSSRATFFLLMCAPSVRFVAACFRSIHAHHLSAGRTFTCG